MEKNMEKYKTPWIEIVEFESEVVSASPYCSSGIETVETPEIVIS